MRLLLLLACGLALALLAAALPLATPGEQAQARAQGQHSGDGQPARRHTANQLRELRLVAATIPPVDQNAISIEVVGEHRHIRSNSVPLHFTGMFPNRGNPHRIRPQQVDVRLPVEPERASAPTGVGLGTFGIALNGVIFEPQAAEWYLGLSGSPWQYEPLGGAVALGLDTQYAHVQRSGTYHYHGVPEGLMRRLGLRAGAPSPDCRLGL